MAENGKKKRELIAHTIVRDERGMFHQFGPGDDVPRWAAVLIKNPGLWSDGDPVHEAVEETPLEIPIPAKSGPKASAAAWAEYAKAKGYEIEEGTSRSEIIDALEADGIPTE